MKLEIKAICPTRPARFAQRAFSLLEIMIAIFILMLILGAIYSIWHGIVRGTRAGIKAAQEVQRSRIAMHAIEQALLSARVFNENIKWYYFVSGPEGSRSTISMTCRLPSDFLGMGFVDPNLRMRRVDFFTRGSSTGTGDELVMSHVPMLIETNSPGGEPYSIVLARDVSRFDIEFVDPRKGDWVTDWTYTNTMPKLVRITLGLGKVGGSSSSEQIVSRIIAMPAQNIVGLSATARPGPPGLVPPPGLNPNIPGGNRFGPGGVPFPQPNPGGFNQ